MVRLGAEIGLVAQAASLIATVMRSMKDCQIYASKEAVETRAGICQVCPKLREKRQVYACTACGCSFQRKITAHGSKCPLGKW